MKRRNITLALSAFLLLGSSAYASESSDIQALKQEVKELREMTQILVDETSDLKTGFNYTVVDSKKSYNGLGAAASKVYYSKSPLSIGGYGEMYYSDTTTNNNTDKTTLDVYRFVPYIGYKFSDNIILNTEIEFEHGGVANNGGTAEGGEVIVEFMYLDFLINKNANIRVGNMLMPIGLINERHEPTLFTTVQRPNTSKYLIPSTWHESGVMVYGDIIDNLSYKFTAVSALQTGVNGSTWLRDGRGGSFKQTDANLAFAARVDYTGINGLLVGASAYSAPSVNGVSSTTNMYDVHLDYKNSGARVYGVYTQTDRSDAAEIATDAVEKAKGGYINFSYDILSLTSIKKQLPIFVQFESINPEQERANGTSGDDLDTTTVGVNYFPHEQVVLKFDYTMARQGAVDTDTASISMGFIF
ncbi:porin [Sulfurimonas sp. CS5]|uniref:porin n=1 Tax=Sulfurimonas sp. CS5 TaxID=3391145 RepID=UPI0039EC71C7